MSISAFDKVLLNLQTLAACPVGGKINSTGEYIVIEPPSFLQGSLRACRTDSKVHAVNRIYSDVSLAVEFAKLMMEKPEKHVDELKKILAALRAASIGIDRLSTTYAGYKSFLAPASGVSAMISSTDSAIVRSLQTIDEY